MLLEVLYHCYCVRDHTCDWGSVFVTWLMGIWGTQSKSSWCFCCNMFWLNYLTLAGCFWSKGYTHVFFSLPPNPCSGCVHFFCPTFLNQGPATSTWCFFPRKDTLEAAQNDAEQLVMDRLRMKEQFVRKLEACGYSVSGKENSMPEKFLVNGFDSNLATQYVRMQSWFLPQFMVLYGWLLETLESACTHRFHDCNPGAH